MTPRTLGHRTTVEVEAAEATVLLVPLGSTEQHGPHLPLDTDTRIAVAWADGIAQASPRLVVAPALPYGSSGEHQAFAGTLSIGQDALERLLIELVRSAATSFEAVVLVCGHAGNAAPVGRAVALLRSDGHRVHALFPRWDGDQIGLDPDAHAGRVETSLLLHIAPEVVALDRAEPGVTTPLVEMIDDLRTGGVAAVSSNGVLGDPDGASGEEGTRLLEDLTQRAITEISHLVPSQADC